MRFEVLGQLEVYDDNGEQITLGSPKQRILLALLLSRANQMVPADWLIDSLWSDFPPKSAKTNLQVYVHQLRHIVFADNDRIIYRQGSYRLDVKDNELDAERFLELASEARQARDRSQPDLARDLFSRSILQWKGRAYDGIDDVPPIRQEALRLAELELVVQEERLEFDLELGFQLAAIPVLTGLVGQHPLRERFRALLMLALYRSGRTADALTCYRDGRRYFVEELGLDPGVELQQLERSIREGDPALLHAPAAKSRANVCPSELPHPPGSFTGRELELSKIREHLTSGERPALVAINGPGGTGKSALAIQAAHELAQVFPEGRLYVNLRGATPGVDSLRPLDVLARFLRALGLTNSQIPDNADEAAALFRSITAGSRMLIVLDDASAMGQIRPLLPGGSDSAVIVTSRPVLGALDGATHLPLAPMTEDDAYELLYGLTAAEPAEIGSLVRLSGRLPLALRIIGARLAARRDLSPECLVTRLANEQSRLDELAYADMTIRSSLATSAAHLPPDATKVLALTSLLDVTTYSMPLIEAITTLSVRRLDHALDELVDAQLFQVAGLQRYATHDLVRLYARELAAGLSEQERFDAIDRGLAWYVESARSASVAISGSPVFRHGLGSMSLDGGLHFHEHASAIVWLDDEAENIAGAARQFATFEDGGHGVGLVGALYVELERILRRDLALKLVQAVVDGEPHGSTPKDWQAYMHFVLGSLCADLTGGRAEGRAHLLRACRLWREADDREGEVMGLSTLAMVQADEGEFTEAEASLHQALKIREHHGGYVNNSAMWNGLGVIMQRQDRHHEAIGWFEKAAGRDCRPDGRYSSTIALAHLAESLQASGSLTRAQTCLEKAVEANRASGDRRMEANSLLRLAGVLDELGEHAAARQRREESAAIRRSAGERIAVPPLGDLARC